MFGRTELLDSPVHPRAGHTPACGLFRTHSYLGMWSGLSTSSGDLLVISLGGYREELRFSHLTRLNDIRMVHLSLSWSLYIFTCPERLWFSLLRKQMFLPRQKSCSAWRCEVGICIGQYFSHFSGGSPLLSLLPSVSVNF